MPRAFPPFTTRRTQPITIAASTWRWDGVSGAVLVSSGFPLKPGQVTATNLSQVRVFVAGAEMAVALHPLDGVFPDGSYRSLGVQFAYSLTHDTPVSAELRINQGTRGTGDLAWVEPTHATHVSKKAVIAPTDPVHLCGTFVTLAPLTPATNDAGVAAIWAAGAVSRWTGSAQNGFDAGGAIYDHQNGLWALYCRTGTRSWYQWAYDWCCEMLGGSIIHNNGRFHQLIPYVLDTDPADVTCTSHELWNPENLIGTNTSCGGPAEWFSLRWISMASAYWMTAWRQPKRHLARFVNESVRNTTVYATMRDRWIDDLYAIRFNVGRGALLPVLVGYLTGCTTTFTSPGGVGGPSAYLYDTWLPWTIDALVDYQWDLGDYRDGVVGMRDNTPPTAPYPEGFANFSIMIIAEYLMLYYDHVSPDARIPGLLQTLADYMIGQTRAATAADQVLYPGNNWTGPYVNLREAAVANPTFTANTVSGSPTLTRTGGTWLAAELHTGLTVMGTGIPSSTEISALAGEVITMNQNATASGTNITVSIPGAGWWIALFPSLFSWVYASTGLATYATWRDRAADTGSMFTGMETKNWGEWFGGTRQNYLYYAHGGTIRDAPGAHPTAILNPPIQPTLG